MDSERRIAGELRPPEYRVLGRRLLALSIGRMLELLRAGCYPITSIGDLVLCVIICSRRVQRVDDALQDRWLAWKVWLWIAWLRVRERGPINLARRVEIFERYVRSHSGRPTLEGRRAAGLPPGAPVLQHLRVVLRAKVGWTQEELEELPISQAWWDYYTWLELEGKARIAAGSEEEAEEDIAEMVAWANERSADWIEQVRKKYEEGGPAGN